MGSEMCIRDSTSAVPGEGKSFIATNLARAFGVDPVNKVLLVDCDLRRPRIHNYLNLAEGPGLSDVLVAKHPITTVIRPGERGVDVITAGNPVSDPTRAIEQPMFAALLHELKKRYRYIILDCPPVLLCPEPITITTIAEGTVLVARAWQTEKKLVRDAFDVIGHNKIIGIVLNQGHEASKEYQYYGYYGHDRLSKHEELRKKGITDKSLDLGEKIGDRSVSLGKNLASKILKKDKK